MRFYGLIVDECGRCIHYHKNEDVVLLKCAFCKKYYACYKCHDLLENHRFKANKKDIKSVLCGVCMLEMDFKEYQKGYCSRCGHLFNPKCKLHEDIYFDDE